MEISFLTLNQQEIFSSIGLKDFREFSRQSVEKAKAAAEQATANYADDGDTMGRIESKGNKIPQIAASRSQDPEPEGNVGVSNSQRVKFSIKKGQYVDLLR